MLPAAKQCPGPATLEEIAAFLEVARTGSFTAAARRLGAPKSTVSRRVSRLEQALGVRLLQRTTRRLALTEAGAIYLELSGRALAGLDEAAQAVQERNEAPRGQLRVTAPHDIGLHSVAPLVAELVRRHPHLSVEAVITDRVVDLVAERVDVAVRAMASVPDSTLVARRVADDRLALFAAPEYLKRRGTPRTLEDLAEHDCVALRAVRGSALWRLVGPEGPREVRVRAVVSANDFSFVKGATLAGAGIAVLPGALSGRDVRARRLRPVLPEYRAPSAGLFVVYPGAGLVPAKVRVFRDLVLERVGRELAEAGGEPPPRGDAGRPDSLVKTPPGRQNPGRRTPKPNHHRKPRETAER